MARQIKGAWDRVCLTSGLLPDLNGIETLHNEQKKPLKDVMWKVNSARKEIRDEADRRLKEIWLSKAFNLAVVKYCRWSAINRIRENIYAVGGHNSYHDK